MFTKNTTKACLLSAVCFLGIHGAAHSALVQPSDYNGPRLLLNAVQLETAMASIKDLVMASIKDLVMQHIKSQMSLSPASCSTTDGGCRLLLATGLCNCNELTCHDHDARGTSCFYEPVEAPNRQALIDSLFNKAVAEVVSVVNNANQADRQAYITLLLDFGSDNTIRFDQQVANPYFKEGMNPELQKVSTFTAIYMAVRRGMAQPKTVKIIDGAFGMQGRREYMEDRDSALDMSDGTHLSGVYDGHGGHECADITENMLLQKIGQLCRGVRYCAECIKASFLAVDKTCVAQASDRSGATVVVARISPSGKLTVANAGDARAVIARAGGKAERLSIDHKAGLPEEVQRIEALGGHVGDYGIPRVDCGRVQIAIARSVGDAECKPWVTADPYVIETTIREGDQFMVLASDGLWDAVEDQEAVDFVNHKMTQMYVTCRSITSAQAAQIAEALVQKAYEQGSHDNIAARLVIFQ